jgi:glycosyltransferase involved in cell wall biosynthesis
MRIGQNPAKYVDHVTQPEKITIAVLSYIPFLSGFYAETLEVLKVCLGTIWDTADLPYDLMVFDNGSCREAQDYLLEMQRLGKIQYLILSEKNLGKGGAWNIIFDAAPGEYIAYTDSDQYFYPGWLSKSMELINTYPNVGMVTARPIRTPREFNTSSIEWASNNPEVTLEEGVFVPWEQFKDFTMSMGITEEKTKEWFGIGGDIRVTYQGVTAFIGAGHFQFMAKKSVLREFLPFDMSKPMGQVRMLDARMNKAGYLRLMTKDPLENNMSNTLANVPGYHKKDPVQSELNGKGWLFSIPLVKRTLLKIYDAIFRLYYDS